MTSIWQSLTRYLSIVRHLRNTFAELASLLVCWLGSRKGKKQSLKYHMSISSVV